MRLPDLTLAQGTGPSLVSRQVQHRLLQVETSLPEGSQVELQLDWGDLTLPGVGSVPLARIVAGGVNWYHRTVGLPHPWPGYQHLAEASGRTTVVRWVKGQPGLPYVLSALGAVPAEVADAAAAPATEEAATVLGADLLPYAALIAAAVAGFLIWQYLDHWSLVRHLEVPVSEFAHAVSTGPSALLLIALVAVPAYLILRR